jgi:hypothetical protein
MGFHFAFMLFFNEASAIMFRQLIPAIKDTRSRTILHSRYALRGALPETMFKIETLPFIRFVSEANIIPEQKQSGELQLCAKNETEVPTP